MTNNLRLMCILAHPDDETLGTGGILAKYAAEGVETYLITATRGQYGWFGPPEENPGPTELGRIRERELRDAANVLGLHEVKILDYIDGYLDQANTAEILDILVAEIRRVRPHVIVTFDPFGAYGHPDHIAISQFSMSAAIAAADANFMPRVLPHRVDKLYYFVETSHLAEIYQQAFGEISMDIDGVTRRSVTWPEWSVTTQVDTSAYYGQVWAAVDCHRTQVPGYAALQSVPNRDALWSTGYLYRAMSYVNGGREVEDDLFAGIRETQVLDR